jgi:hypothetical protein
VWLFTTVGFFSATRIDFQSPGYQDVPRPEDWETTPYLMVRARVRKDLEKMAALYLKTHGKAVEILALPAHDYQYRCLIPRRDFAKLMRILTEGIDYSNFKDAVKEAASSHTYGRAVSDLYLRVWSTMYDAEAWIRSRVFRISEPQGPDTV